MTTLNRTASWVIIHKDTGRHLFETYNEKIAMAINTGKYKAVPILEYLQSINEKEESKMKDDVYMWSFERDGDIYDAEYASKKEAMKAADEWFWQHIIDAHFDGSMRVGEVFKETVHLVSFIFDDEGERVIDEREELEVRYEHEGY